ncbi:MAG: pitrilysin family protein [Nitrospirota bacterium]
MIRKVVLENGIRIIAEPMPSVKSVSIGLWINIGSRDEEAHEHGMSHFLEHMFFKGTKRRSAGQIAQEIDAIGGELNAFTSRENTTFYAKVLEDHLPKAVELLSDNFHHSKFESRELEKEKQVVMEEIKMVEDDPEDLAHTLHIEDMLKGNPLGRTILGTTETLSLINRKKIINFLERTYSPSQIVIAVAGKFKFDALLSLLQKEFEDYRQDNTRLIPRIPPEITPQFQVKKRKLEQVHLCVSTPGLSIVHPQREALHLLNVIMGGGISSHLFQEVRERRGLAYSIYSAPSFYHDGGIFTIYAGTGPKNAPKVMDLIYKEIKKMKDRGITSEELKKAKEHIKGSILLGMESSGSRMSRLAKDEFAFGRSFKMEEVVSGINRVTLKQIHEVANTLFNSKMISVTALGPIEAHALPGPVGL